MVNAGVINGRRGMGTQFLCEPVFLGWYSEESRWFCGLFVNHGKLDPRGEAAGSAGGGEQRLHVLGHAHRPEGLPAQRAQHLRRGRHALRPTDPGTLFSAVVSRDDSGYGLTGYGSYRFVTSYTILTVYYCNRSNLALLNWY